MAYEKGTFSRIHAWLSKRRLSAKALRPARLEGRLALSAYGVRLTTEASGDRRFGV